MELAKQGKAVVGSSAPVKTVPKHGDGGPSKTKQIGQVAPKVDEQVIFVEFPLKPKSNRGNDSWGAGITFQISRASLDACVVSGGDLSVALKIAGLQQLHHGQEVEAKHTTDYRLALGVKQVTPSPLPETYG